MSHLCPFVLLSSGLRAVLARLWKGGKRAQGLLFILMSHSTEQKWEEEEEEECRRGGEKYNSLQPCPPSTAALKTLTCTHYIT